MIIRKIRDYILSQDRSLEERRFVFASLLVCFSLFIVLVTVLATQSRLGMVGACIAAIVLTLVLMRVALKTKKYTVYSIVIVLISHAFILPMGYLMGGGIHSGAPFWLILGGVIVFLLFRGKLLFVFICTALMSIAESIYLGIAHPEWVVPLHEGISEEADTLLSIILVTTIIGAVYLVQSKVLEAEIKNTREQSQEVEKLNRTQNNFFSSMSHEIRTPISTIIGLNEMNMREKNLSQEVLENTYNIQNASKMLLTLINDLLDMSKIQSEKMEIVPTEYDTSRMLSDITNLHWNRANEKELRFDIQVSENLPPYLYGDETRIKQVVTNLLTNAIKYTEEGSVILRFGGEFVGTDKFILTIEVEDTGIGIRKENIQYLFDAFRRVEGSDTKNIEGTGLGLAISKQLTELMGGNLTVDSIYTKGSTFRVEIPQGVVNKEAGTVRKPGLVAHETETYEQSFEAPEARVLVVDDNDMNRIVCQKLLRATKVQVDTAKSGQECLEMTAQNHYDAILMDHEMPQMDGIEALRRLRQQPEGLCRNTPVIALTANAGSDREAFYIDRGFSAYLAKPIQSSQLEALLLASLPPDMVEKKNVVTHEEVFNTYETVHKIPFMITTDSICDLPDDILRDMDIKVMPYYIETGVGRFRDLNEIDADNLQNYLASSGQTAYSEPAPVEEYEKFFGDVLTEARFVLHLSSAKAVSHAYDNAQLAANSFGNIMVMDTEQISAGLGMMAVKASELFKSGLRLEEALDELERYKRRIQLNFLVPSVLDVNSKYKAHILPRILMNVLNFEPVFTIKKGRLRIKRFLLGYIRSTGNQFVRGCLQNRNKIKTDRLYVIFSGYPPEQRALILDNIGKYIQFDEIIVNKASAASFANLGANCVGLVYESKIVE